ncbi:MAG: ABC transporter [Pirellulaceae bacterium]|nr:MAG: ABC transporter [Pirellulaceae bacterium]
MPRQTPLAWYNLTSSWRKCLLSASGVAFAVVLMFMQIGFRGALIDNNVRILSLFDLDYANLAVISRARYNLTTEQRFSRYLLEAIAGRPTITDVTIVQLERGTAKVKVAGHRAKPIRVMAVDIEARRMFADASLWQRLQAAQRQGAALVDRRSKPSYGFAAREEQLLAQSVELNGQQLPLLGFFELGTDFSSDGTLLLTPDVFAEYFPWRNGAGSANGIIDIGLLHADVDRAEELSTVAADLQSLAPAQIQVLPTAELIAAEKRFWLQATPIGKIFTIGTLLGFVVGAIICYQLLFTDITEHLPEFATLQAMGYSSRYFVSLVLWQSLYLSCLGFLPGLLVSLGLYQVLTATSGLYMSMPVSRVALVFLLTTLMCILSGLIAMRKLYRADPASLF